ncbi:MAG: AAA family ATPase [Blastocatellia bacterium]|nr:AAA family ATPase [Blastocatellia bacterium]
MTTNRQKTDMQEWLAEVSGLCSSPDWTQDELPVEIKQTHISALLLGRRRVLKLKKPVDFGFLDYTTLEKRRRACEAEVALNRRLCPDIYLGVQPVVESGGQFRLSEEGRVVDYGVLMKRLPDDFMLDRMVAEGRVTEAIIDRVAERLHAFHKTARRGSDVDRHGSPEQIRYNWEENFTQTRPYTGRSIAAQDFDLIRDWVEVWLDSNDELLRSRVREGWIRDGHGDVRCESINVTDGICIFDCIEFNDRFRCDDVASEVAFLAMDLDARARPDLGYYFSERYHARSDDHQLFALLPFYRCYRAYVRGKVLSFRLDEPEFSKSEREAAAARAANYFDLARRYASPLKQPTVIAVGGLSGTGKTSVARAIAGELGLRVASSDVVRELVFGDAKRPTGFGKGAYTPEAGRLTYQKLVEAGRSLLEENRGVVLDATFLRGDARALARRMAEEAGARWRFIECRLSPESVRQRLEHRAALKEGLSDATWEIYLRQSAEHTHISDGSAHLALDTGGSLAEVSRGAADWLRAKDL